MSTPTEESIMKDFAVEIFKPEGAPSSITVFLPGTLLDLADFQSTYESIVAQKQVVIAFKRLNPMPIVGISHNKMAENAVDVVKAFRALEGNDSLPAQYNLVGHSLGGKVALMVAAKFDVDHANKVIAIDPVDDKPRELTAPRLSPRTPLTESKAEIHLFQSENGGKSTFPLPALAPSDRNASIIEEMYPEKIASLTIDEGAGHMSYLDDRDDEASVKARQNVQNKIRGVIN